MRKLVGISAICGIWIAAIPASPRQQVPQFRAGTDITRLEVTVLDRKTRRPIRGLTAADFKIKVSGRLQTVVAISEVEHAKVGAASGALAERAHDVSSNERRPERLFVIVMDDATGTNDPFERKAGMEVANRIVDLMDRERDLGAVVFTRNNRHAQDFTRDRTLLRQAIGRFNPVPQGHTRVLDRTLQFLQEMPGFRRAIFFVSAGQAGAATGALRTALQNSLDTAELGRESGADVTLGAVGPGGISHVPVYMFSTVGLKAPTAGDLVSGRVASLFDNGTAEAFRRTARATGGRAVVDHNLPVAEVPAIFEEMETYYVLGFRHDYPTDGALRWLQVDVGRPDVIVMPSDLAIEAPDTGPEGAAAAPTVGRRSGLMELLEAAVSDGTLPLRLGLVPMATSAAGSETIATLGLPAPRDGMSGVFQVSMLVFDGEGRRQLQRVDRAISVKSGAATEVVFPLKLAPERYAVRVAVEEVGGNAGTVHATVVVPDVARDAVALSGVAVGRAESGSIGGREAIQHLLPFAPTAIRAFAPSERVGALVRVYQGTRNRQGSVVLTTEVINDSGSIVMSTEQTYSPTPGAPGSEHRFELPLKQLGPGDYVLRFVAKGSGSQAQRDVRFRVK
jgi:VWFA-related protein